MIHPVRIPHEQVNDQSVLLVEWMLPDGSEVKAGQPVAVIETSKSTAEIEAPEAGFLRHGAAANSELPVGAVFCHVTTSPTEPIPAAAPENKEERSTVVSSSPAPAPAPAAVSSTSHQPESTPVSPAQSGSAEATFSRRALELIEKHGLSKQMFAGRGMVREADIHAILSGGHSAPAANGGARQEAPVPAGVPSPAPAAPIVAAGVPYRTEELSRAKRVEIRYLASGQANTLPSVVTVACPTAGLRAALEQSPDLGSSATAVIVYEVARLLKKYPIFNACYVQGKVHYYEQVNIGLAVDGDHGLKVPVIAQADQKGLPEIAREMEALLLDYVNDELPVSKLAGGTFTITDLSSESVVAFHPLINQGQAAILGIGAEYGPGDPGRAFSNLILAFDHQLTEGRTAARLLADLRDRIATYEGVVPGGAASEWGCAHCNRSRTELARLRIPLLQEVTSTGSRALICRTCLGGALS